MKDCVSLEVAKKLQEVGYKGKCSLYFDGNNDIFEPDNPETNQYAKIPAPTATQLIEEMIKKIEHFHFGKNVAGGFFLKAVFTEYPIVNADSFSDALGLMMCYLIENSLLK